MAEEVVKDTEWYSIQLERVFCGMFIRVVASPNQHRWRWFVTPTDKVSKAPNWYSAGKGASEADARGYSSSCEGAMVDAEAMAKQLSARGAQKKNRL